MVSSGRSTTRTTRFKRDSFSMTTEIVFSVQQHCVTNSPTGCMSRAASITIMARALWNGTPSTVPVLQRCSTATERTEVTTTFSKTRQQISTLTSLSVVVRSLADSPLMPAWGVIRGEQNSNATNRIPATSSYLTFTLFPMEHFGIRVLLVTYIVAAASIPSMDGRSLAITECSI